MTALAMTEADLMACVIDLARILGYRVAHFRPALTARGWRTPVAADGKGFPDLLLVGRGRIIAAELKADKGKMTDDQLAWIHAFADCGATAVVFRPADLDSGMIESVLR